MFDFDIYDNTKKRGDAGVGIAIAHYTVSGKTVSIPITDSQDYDLIVEFPDGLKKVQVKTVQGTVQTGKHRVSLRIGGGNSKENYTSKFGPDVIYDILFVVCDNGDLYEIPKSEFKGHRNSITMESWSSFKV